MSNKINLKSGEYLFREGESANYAYVVDEGEVEIVKASANGNIILALIPKGAIIGEMALIDGLPRSASAIAKSDTILTEVNSQTFIQYIKGNPNAAVNIMKRLSGLLREANQRFTNDNQAENDKGEVLSKEFDDYLGAYETVSGSGILDTDQIYDASPTKSVILAGATVSLGFISAIIFLSIFSIDTTVRASGKFLTTVPNIEVQATNSSVIKSLRVSRGASVFKGQIIAVLDGTVADSNLNANREKLSAVERKLIRIELEQELIKSGKTIFNNEVGLDALNFDILVKRVDQFNSKLLSLNTKIKKLSREISYSMDNVSVSKKQLDLKKRMEDVQKSLYEQKVASHFKYLSARDAALTAEKSFSDSLAKLDTKKSELKVAEANKKEFYSKWVSSLGETQGKEGENLIQLQEENVKLSREADDTEVRAPADGVVLDLPKLGFGSVVKEGDKIFTLVRSNVPLALEVDIDPKDINDVRIDADASIKLDALPFQEYGDIKGKLTYVSDDTYEESLSGDKGAFFRARVSVKGGDLTKLPSDFKLTPGMTATADLLIGKRNLLSYLTRPITKGFSKAFSEPD